VQKQIRRLSVDDCSFEFAEKGSYLLQDHDWCLTEDPTPPPHSPGLRTHSAGQSYKGQEGGRGVSRLELYPSQHAGEYMSSELFYIYLDFLKLCGRVKK
jgi:hypothetical protein